VASEQEMPKYNDEFKEQAVRKMMPPNALSVAQLSRDTGVSDVTLYNWRNRFRNEGKAVPADPSNPENWTGENKLAVVIETSALNEEGLAEYCRQKGLYVEQIARWREAAAAGAETQRWFGTTRNWNPVEEVWLNPPKGHQAEIDQDPKAA
jgi:transposase